MSILLHSRSTTQSALGSAHSSHLSRLVVSVVMLLALGLAALGAPKMTAATFPRVSHPTQLVDGPTPAPAISCYGVLAGC